MPTAMGRKAKMTLAIGFVVFVVGTSGAAYLGTRHTGQTTPSAAGATVLYAAQPLATGTLGSTALNQGLVKTKTIAAPSVPAGALTDPAQLANGIAAVAVPSGAVITADMFPAPKTRIGTVVIPPGKRALTLRLEPVAGIAGFAGAGDHVDIYAVRKSSDGGPPGVRLVLQGVEVLSINGTGLTASPGQPGGPEYVYLLAVTPTEAERLIYISEFEKLYFDLVAKGEPPVGPTPGAGAAQTLQTV